MSKPNDYQFEGEEYIPMNHTACIWGWSVGHMTTGNINENCTTLHDEFKKRPVIGKVIGIREYSDEFLVEYNDAINNHFQHEIVRHRFTGKKWISYKNIFDISEL